MSAWSRSLYLDLAQQLACGAIAVNEAAGGAVAFKSVTDYAGALATIACQLNAANNAQGATAVALDFSSIPGLTQTIACLTGSLAGTNVPYGSYDMYAQWNAIACNLNTIAEATGGASPGGLQGGSIYAFMNAAICSMNQIAENGFGPVDPVQEFINAINAFNPDVLLIGDRGTNTIVNGQPVTLWEDQSGNGNDGSPATGQASPTFSLSSLSGKSGVLFNPTATPNQGIVGPFVNNGSTGTAVFVYSASAGGGAFARIVSSGAGNDAGTDSFIFSLLHSDTTLEQYGAGSLCTLSPSLNSAHSGASWFDGANAHLIANGVTATPVAFSNVMSTTKYAIGNNVSDTGGGDAGKCTVWFAAIFAANKAASINSILATVNNYYGL